MAASSNEASDRFPMRNMKTSLVPERVCIRAPSRKNQVLPKNQTQITRMPAWTKRQTRAAIWQFSVAETGMRLLISLACKAEERKGDADDGALAGNHGGRAVADGRRVFPRRRGAGEFLHALRGHVRAHPFLPRLQRR